MVTPCFKKPGQKHHMHSVFSEEILKIVLKVPINNIDEIRICPTTFSRILMELLCRNREFRCFRLCV